MGKHYTEASLIPEKQPLRHTNAPVRTEELYLLTVVRHKKSRYPKQDQMRVFENA
jgi:hypothetical protein